MFLCLRGGGRGGGGRTSDIACQRGVDRWPRMWDGVVHSTMLATTVLVYDSTPIERPGLAQRQHTTTVRRFVVSLCCSFSYCPHLGNALKDLCRHSPPRTRHMHMQTEPEIASLVYFATRCPRTPNLPPPSTVRGTMGDLSGGDFFFEFV